jgi:hypothetical protein
MYADGLNAIIVENRIKPFASRNASNPSSSPRSINTSLALFARRQCDPIDAAIRRANRDPVSVPRRSRSNHAQHRR